MSDLFSQHVRDLERGEDGDAEAVLTSLRNILVGEMRHRGLRNAPPGYLGFSGAEWTPALLEEATVDCYLHAILEKQDALAARLGDDAEGLGALVRLNVRHYLTERQRRSDPLGYRIYTIYRSAVRKAIEAGALKITAGDLSVGNATVLAHADTTTRGAELLSRDQLSELAEAWHVSLMPALANALGRRQQAVVGDLSERIAEVGLAHGTVRFGDLVAVAKRDVRARWHSVLVTGIETGGVAGDSGEWVVVPVVKPAHAFEDRERLTNLSRCVERFIEAPGLQRRVREHLHRIWAFSRSLALEDRDLKLPARLEGKLARGLRLPHLSLAQMLDIPVDSMKKLLENLRALIASCYGVGGAEVGFAEAVP